MVIACGPDVGRIEHQVPRAAGLGGAAQFAGDAIHRHPLGEVVAVASDDARVIVDAVAGGDLAAVLDHAPAVVGPDADHARRQFERPAPQQPAPLHPTVQDELRRRTGPLLAHNLDLPLMASRIIRARPASSLGASTMSSQKGRS